MIRIFRKAAFAILLGIAAAGCSQTEKGPWIATAPAGDRMTQVNRRGETVIPNGRILTPRGRQIEVAPHPYGLTLSPDGSVAVTANSGTAPFSISVIKNVAGADPEVMQVPKGYKTDKGVLASVFMGLAVTPDNRYVFVSGGQENEIYRFDLQTGEKTATIDCAVAADAPDDGRDFEDGFIGDMVLSKDGRRLYAVDQINFRMLIIDTRSLKVIHSVDVGRYPFGITLSPDGKEAYVANVGMFEYSIIASVNPDSLKQTALSYPPYAYGSKEMREGIHNDTLDVQGLGDPNTPQSFSVWTVNLRDADHPAVTHKTKTGVLVGEMVEGIPAVGGSSPNSVVATGKYVFVSNGNNDSISVISTRQDTVVQTIPLVLDERLSGKRGIIPFGLALSPDKSRLYVAEAGINAVGVIDTENLQLLGHMPTAWFPSKLKVSPDGKKLIVANAKGFGSGPNGGPDFKMGPEGSYIGSLMNGTVSVMDIPGDEELKGLTRQVIKNNFDFDRASAERFDARRDNPVPLYPGQKESPIKHIVFITKENRTYDEIFGQVKGAEGDADLARFGEHVSVENDERTKRLKDVDVMPNHLKLAREFALSDNFYVDSDVSADGHRWLSNTYPNEWVESEVPLTYGGGRRPKHFSKAPGARGFEYASGAIYPEDYNEAGSMWDHFGRHNISFMNFGEGIMFEPHIIDQSFKYSGYKYAINYPVPSPLYAHTSRKFPTYNLGIPDQFRVDMFKEEFEEKWINTDTPMPQVLTVILGNDHGTKERPEDGYPFFESYMADNDLAVGRIVEYLSHTPYWKNMMIVVTEDDAQGGVDHVDAHRSVLMVISPYVKRGHVSHRHYSFGSLFKTFWNVLGVPYLNQYDAGASDLADFFTDQPNLAPYNAVAVDHRLFDPEKALDPLDENFNWEQLKNLSDIDEPEDMIRQSRKADRERMKEQEMDADGDR